MCCSLWIDIAQCNAIVRLESLDEAAVASFLFVFGVLNVLTPLIFVVKNLDQMVKLDIKQRMIVANMLTGGITLITAAVILGLM